MVRRRTWTVVLVAVVLIGAAIAYGVLAVDRPQIESVENEWGTVTNERTEVETRIAVDNPRLLRVGDAAADVSYTVSLNDVEIATERKNRVRLSGDENVIAVSTWIDNDDIPDWWATHVNGNETTTVRIEPDVIVDYAGVRLPATQWTRTRTVRTDLLEPLEVNRSRTFDAYGRTVLIINETDAAWGTATANRTPIDASATVTNPTAVPIPITEVGYTVRLNGIVVGQGVAARETLLSPGSTRTLEASAAIDNAKLDEWWVTHVRNDETSNLTVDFNATIEYGGVERTLPLEFLSFDRTFETALFADAESGTNESSSSREPVVNRSRTLGDAAVSRSRDPDSDGTTGRASLKG